MNATQLVSVQLHLNHTSIFKVIQKKIPNIYMKLLIFIETWWVPSFNHYQAYQNAILTYTAGQLYPTSSMSQNTNTFIDSEPRVTEKQTIPHLEALRVHVKIPEDQGRGCFRGLPRPLFVKSVLFRKKGRGKSLMLPRPCPSRILLSTTIAKK